MRKESLETSRAIGPSTEGDTPANQDGQSHSFFGSLSRLAKSRLGRGVVAVLGLSAVWTVAEINTERPITGIIIPRETNAEPGLVYKVSSDESLSEIAGRLGISVGELVRFNEARYPSLRTNPNMIYSGWELVVSHPPGVVDSTGRNKRIVAVTPETFASIENYLFSYREAASKNIVYLPDGQAAVLASPAYANGVYGRDSFFAALGLGDVALSEHFYRWFERTQDTESGQVLSAVPFSGEDDSLVPKDDETTLLYIIWSGLLQRQGKEISKDSVTAAYQFIQSHVRDGYYFSQPGPFRYWADNFLVQDEDVITYNQGLFVIALESLQRMGVGNITQETVRQAKGNYLGLYSPRLGYLKQSKNTSYQDVSALFPEVLHRYLFGSNLLPDEVVLQTVSHHLATTSVSYPDGTLAGMKNIAESDGDFLAPEAFEVTDFADYGDYQNGGYWPMWTLSELALAYKISGEAEYLSAIEQLLTSELESNGQSKEFLRLQTSVIGDFDSFRESFSWNVLFVPVAKWAGILAITDDLPQNT